MSQLNFKIETLKSAMQTNTDKYTNKCQIKRRKSIFETIWVMSEHNYLESKNEERNSLSSKLNMQLKVL